MLITQLIGSLSSINSVVWAPPQLAALAAGNLAQYELSGPLHPVEAIGDGMRLSIECAERLAAIGPDELATTAASEHPRMATYVATVTAIAVIFVPLGFAVLVMRIADGPEGDALLLGLPGWASWMLALPWLVAALVAATGVATLIGWIGRRGSRLERIGTTAVALAGGGAVAVLVAYGFLQVG
jgi:hypothetical protein